MARLIFPRRNVLALAAGLWAALAAPVRACDFDDADGLADIGVVLSGGGAMASTQVGALAVMEEAGVPIHCIVGTSMGGVVAGLYAAGYDAAEINALTSDADWESLIRGQEEFRNKSFREKERSRDIFADFVAGRTEDGISLPAGYNTLEKMRRALRNRTVHVSGITDFDELPTPFRTVGTDLSRGEGITLGQGDLVAAMLATMAVPGVYPAQKIGEHVLVDGGMSKQIAVDVAKDMGADIVIVVDTTIVPRDIDSVPNIAGTVQQLVQIMVWQNWKRQVALLTDDDLHLQPDLDGLGSGNFTAVELGYQRGREVAEAELPRLREIADMAAPPTRWRPRPWDTGQPIISVRVEDGAGIDPDVIIARAEVATGDPSDPAAVDAGLTRVGALETFGTVDYNFAPSANGSILTIMTSERSLGRERFQVGAQFSNTFDGFSDYQLLGRYTRRPINSHAGELSVTAAIGDDLLVAAELFQPIGGRGAAYIAPSISHTALSVPVQLDTVALNQNWIQTTAANLQVGRELGISALVSADIFVRHADTEPIFATSFAITAETDDGPVSGILVDSLSGQTLTYAGGRARLAADSFDAAQFPTSGASFDFSATYLNELSNELDIEDFWVGEASIAAATSIGKLGLYGQIDAGTVTQSADPSNVFYLGGFKRVSGARDQSLPATEYVLARIEAYQRLTSLRNVTGLATYVGGTVEMAEISFDNPFLSYDGEVFAGSVYGAMVTPVGPLYLSYGRSEGGRQAVYFFFGQAF